MKRREFLLHTPDVIHKSYRLFVSRFINFSHKSEKYWKQPQGQPLQHIVGLKRLVFSLYDEMQIVVHRREMVGLR